MRKDKRNLLDIRAKEKDNKTKDSGLRDQWYKLLKQVPQEPLELPPSHT